MAGGTAVFVAIGECPPLMMPVANLRIYVSINSTVLATFKISFLPAAYDLRNPLISIESHPHDCVLESGLQCDG